MTTQTTYKERLAPLSPGHIAGTDYDTRTGICETASPGIPFGRAVSQGTLSDQGRIIGGALATLKGISVYDATLRVEQADAYVAPNSMGVLERGGIWVEPTVAVVANDPVWFNATTGTFNKSTGVGPIPGAYFMDSCGIGGRARVFLPGGRYA